MTEKNIGVLLKVFPKTDKRLRSTKTAKLWVINHCWSKDKSHNEVCGVIESIERTIYKLKGKNGHWVRYLNRYYPIHTAEEFSKLLANVEKKKIDFFNNEIQRYDIDSFLQTESAPFICWDEAGFKI